MDTAGPLLASLSSPGRSSNGNTIQLSVKCKQKSGSKGAGKEQACAADAPARTTRSRRSARQQEKIPETADEQGHPIEVDVPEELMDQD